MGWKVCSFQEQVLQITLILHVICKVHALGGTWFLGEVLLSAQTSQYVGWIVLILSGASFCVLLLDKHTWEFKSNYAVVFLGGMGPGTRGFMQTRQSKLLLCMCLILTVP